MKVLQEENQRQEAAAGHFRKKEDQHGEAILEEVRKKKE